MVVESQVVNDMLERLKKIREQYGDAAFQDAAEQAARELLSHGPETAALTRELLKDVVNFEKLDREPRPTAPPPMTPEQVVTQQIRQQVPGIQTQAQFDVFMEAFNALRLYMNHTFVGEQEKAASAREALLSALDAAKTATDLSARLGHVPEAATSKEAEAFKNPPREFHELEVQQSLLSELSKLDSVERLDQWYLVNRSRIDLVVSSNYRNALYDSIRSKKSDLMKAKYARSSPS